MWEATYPVGWVRTYEPHQSRSSCACLSRQFDYSRIAQKSPHMRVGSRNIVLIDDVLFTGRTVRAALDELIDFGRPKRVSLVVLVDRGHRELPIEAEFAAIKIQTKRNESVNLHLQETDKKEDIVVCEAVEE